MVALAFGVLLPGLVRWRALAAGGHLGRIISDSKLLLIISDVLNCYLTTRIEEVTEQVATNKICSMAKSGWPV